jgi:hypothetical protein
MLNYTIKFANFNQVPSGSVHLCSGDKTWHVAAYSCYDQRQRDKTGIACWNRLRLLHKSKPLHVLLGTGDQVALSSLLFAATPDLTPWFLDPDKIDVAVILKLARSHSVAS